MNTYETLEVQRHMFVSLMVLNIWVLLSELGKQAVRMELAQDRVQWRTLVLAVLNLRVLLPESQLISEMDLRETGCEDGTGSGLCPVAGFCGSGAELLVSATIEFCNLIL
jgi:hypothetical protein